MLAIAHRTPVTAEGCTRLAGIGVTVFEVDVQFLDGVPVVSHFLPLWSRLPRLRHDRWRFTVRARGRAEEDLAAAVERVPAGAAVLVDLKSDAAAADLVALLRASPRPPSGWYVSGTDPAALAVVAAAGYRTWYSIATRAALTGPRPAGLDAVTVRHTYLSASTVRRLGPRVMAWTVPDVRRARELASYGVAGITSDSDAVHAFVASSRAAQDPH